MLRQDFWARLHRKFGFSLNKHGVWFDYHGDEVLWLFPWYKPHLQGRFVSVGFTGNGDFGDARFKSLKDLDETWKGYFSG